MSETQDTKSLRIEYRHLAFFFLGAVCICAVFFALGFVVGRGQPVEMVSKDQVEAKSLASGPASASPSSAVSTDDQKGAESSGKTDDEKHGAVGVDYRKDLDFYAAVKEPKADQNFHPESPKPKEAAPSGKKVAANSESHKAASSTRTAGSRSGLLSLQVAALKSSAEADRLAKTLRSKGFPVFILNPSKDDSSKLIRVQIGPYTSEAEASKAKSRLGSEGYTAITKH